ncbi:ZmpA/ZmpB/ZmpC family metallo-endopeptidase, partial [Streptococcus pneumoniae]|uniref:ZmpA/ZmpB/ZmpC family metallo-endopeptidase n=1 Tax=Streptococcus pneumoniae TaxID=1313 RepID=UPI000A84388A
LMMLDHVEADAVLPQLNGDNSKWFKKIDREMRRNLGDGLNNLVAPHQWDNVRDLNQEESSKKLSSINDLIDNNFMTKKVSNNQFSNLEDWKKYWYHDVKSRAEKGFTEITIDGQTIHNYNELKDL